MKALPCRHAEAARALAILWRDRGPEMGGVADAKHCRRMVSFHAGRCARFLKLRKQAGVLAARTNRGFAVRDYGTTDHRTTAVISS